MSRGIKSIMCLLTCVVMLLSLMPRVQVPTFAVNIADEYDVPSISSLESPEVPEIVVEGTCGENISWSLDNTGVLTLGGAGPMINYNYNDHSPWYKYRNEIKAVVIRNGMYNIGNYAFVGCSNLTSVIIPESVTSIGEWSFGGCRSLTSVKIPERVTSIGNCAFDNCRNLTTITIPESVTSIGYEAFFNCSSLTSITIPEGVTSISEWTFAGCCSLTSVIIPESVSSIGNYAFSDCSSLTSITIPESVTSIGGSAFFGCNNLTSIKFMGSAPTFDLLCFSRVETTVYHPCSNVNWPDSVKENYGGSITWKGHLFSEYVYHDATCTQNATYTGSCPDCGAIDRITIPYTAFGHSYEQVVKQPTCTEDGCTTYICHCGHSYVDDEIVAMGHSYQTVTVVATCTEDGSIVTTCTICGETDTQIIPATGHGFDDYIYNGNATCTADGTMTAQCDRCEETDTKVAVGTAGHTFSDYVPNKDATCTMDGTKTATCQYCGELLTVLDYGTAVGHVFTNYIYNENATCTADGTKTAKCDRCDVKDTQVAVGSKGHKDENMDCWCDLCGCWIEHECISNDGDIWCDLCRMLMEHDCTDANEDWHCDICLCRIEHACINENGDHWCDLCGWNISGACAPVHMNIVSYLDEDLDGAIGFSLMIGDNIVAGFGDDLVENHFVDTWDIELGTYEWFCEKEGHVGRTGIIVVGEEGAELNVTLCPIGDVTGDGRVNVGDVSKLYAHIRSTAQLTDEYQLLCANVNGGSLNVGDVSAIYAHIKGTKKLF